MSLIKFDCEVAVKVAVRSVWLLRDRLVWSSRNRSPMSGLSDTKLCNCRHTDGKGVLDADLVGIDAGVISA